VSEPVGERLARLRRAGGAADDDLVFLVECLGADRKVVQRPAAEVLGRALAAGDPRVRPLLDEALAAPSLALRWGAVYAWSRAGAVMPGGALGVLFEVLGLADGDMRWAAAAIVVGMGAPAVEALVELARGGNAAQRKMALYCLRDLSVGTARVLECAQRGLDDDDVGVRLGAMAALARLAAPAEAARAIVGRLADADAGARRTAAATLGRLGVDDPAVVSALRDAAEADDAVLARTARRALDRFAAPG
jgi:HEAT repeat protein